MEKRKDSFWARVGRLFTSTQKAEDISGAVENIPDMGNKKPKKPIKPGRSSRPSHRTSDISFLKNETSIVNPAYIQEVVPYIRKLIMVNPDVGQALNNVVALGNTGIKIHFDPSVDNLERDNMRFYINEKFKAWGKNYGGRQGLINRLFSQCMTGGAVSTEAVISDDLKTIERIALPNPETIRFAYSHKKGYEPYQKIDKNTQSNWDIKTDYIKLNPHTFRYAPLNGDTEEPYGYPPYLAALPALKNQKTMLDNITFIIEQMGVLGFLQLLLEKPDKLDTENDAEYEARLDAFLKEASKRASEGFRDGISVGFKEDVEYDFQSASKNASGVNELFQENELQIASGLKTDASLLGRGYSTSETQITIVFTKLIAELGNIQKLVKEVLEYYITLELKLQGWDFKYLRVDFNPSTLLDELKMQQGQEIKIRNVQAKYLLGIISLETAADELGYEKPDQKKPRMIKDTSEEAKKKQEREKSKDESDKRTRRKNKPQEG